MTREEFLSHRFCRGEEIRLLTGRVVACAGFDAEEGAIGIFEPDGDRQNIKWVRFEVLEFAEATP